jgi:thymidylate kinase
MTGGRRGRLIAFCGIDGAGKSSLIRRLADEEAIAGAVYLRNRRRTTMNVVIEYGPCDEEGRRDWAQGPFAENVAAAAAIDFLHHYDREIAPRLAGGNLLVCDRYALCCEAFLRAAGSRFRLGGAFERLRRPDLLI